MVNVILTSGPPEAVPEMPGSAPQAGAEAAEIGFSNALIIALGLSGEQKTQAEPVSIGVPVPEEAKTDDPNTQPQADAQAGAQAQVVMVPVVGQQCPQPVPDQPGINPENGEPAPLVQSAPIISVDAGSGQVAVGQEMASQPPGASVDTAAANVTSELELVEPEAPLNAPAVPESAGGEVVSQPLVDAIEPENAVAEAKQASESDGSLLVQATEGDKPADRASKSDEPRTFSREARQWVDSSFDERAQAAKPEKPPSASTEKAGPVESAAQSLRRPAQAEAEPAPPPDPSDRARPVEAPKAHVTDVAPVQPLAEARADVQADVGSRNSDAPVQPVAAAAVQPLSTEAPRADAGVVRQAEQAPTTEQHTRVIEQIVREVQLNQSDGRRDIVVRLNPPELGTLRLQISQDMAGMTSHIQASTDQVKGLLQAHVPALVEALSNAGIRVDAVSVSSGPMFGAFAQDTTGNAYGRQDQQKRSTANKQTAGGIEATALFAARETQSYQAGHSWLA